MNGFYEKVKAVLAEHGFFMSRQKGSHQTWKNGSLAVTLSTNCASRHTANKVLKDAGIDFKF